MNYSSLLLPAASLSDPVSRLQQVATFAVSALAGNENRSLAEEKGTVSRSDPDLDPDPHVFGPPGFGSCYYQAK
jgi:hypothetical protein